MNERQVAVRGGHGSDSVYLCAARRGRPIDGTIRPIDLGRRPYRGAVNERKTTTSSRVEEDLHRIRAASAVARYVRRRRRRRIIALVASSFVRGTAALSRRSAKSPRARANGSPDVLRNGEHVVVTRRHRVTRLTRPRLSRCPLSSPN